MTGQTGQDLACAERISTEWFTLCCVITVFYESEYVLLELCRLTALTFKDLY